MPDCRRCGQPTKTCSDCKGDGSIWGGVNRMTCNTCDGTGEVCPKDGKHWR